MRTEYELRYTYPNGKEDKCYYRNTADICKYHIFDNGKIDYLINRNIKASIYVNKVTDEFVVVDFYKLSYFFVCDLLGQAYEHSEVASDQEHKKKIESVVC